MGRSGAVGAVFTFRPDGYRTLGGMTEPAPRTIHDIPGWFWWTDQCLVDLVLRQQADDPPGTLVELGTYLGKSAVLIGEHLRDGEHFIVCDLFGDELPLTAGAAVSPPTDGHDDPPGTWTDNRAENRRSYATLDRLGFERNYLAFHPQLPQIVQDRTSTIGAHVPDGTARFVHVDASHLYGQVAMDLLSTKAMLRADGVVVVDDVRSQHTPGVAAATWGAVATEGLVPFALSPSKLYGTFGDPDRYRDAVLSWAGTTPRFTVDVQQIAGHPVARVAPLPQRKAAPPPDLSAALDGLRRELAVVRTSVETTSGDVSALSAGLDRAVDLAVRRAVRRVASSRESARRLGSELLPPMLGRRLTRPHSR